jgi:hypothetical protein
MQMFRGWLIDLKWSAPLTERIAQAFGFLTGSGDQWNVHVPFVVRYLLATRGFIESGDFESLMSRFDRFPDRKFLLGKYLVDLTSCDRPDVRIVRVDVTSDRDKLFECLKNVLSLICGAHPCVLKFEGWNIERKGDQLQFVTVTSGAVPLEEDEIARWDNLKREKFVIGIAAAVSHLHSLYVFHDNFSLSSVLVHRETSGPRIGGFGLSSTNAEFRYEIDSLSCGQVFDQILPSDHPWRNHSKLLMLLPEFRISLEEFVSECLKTTTDPIRNYVDDLCRQQDQCQFTFDMLIPLSRSPDKWMPQGGDVDIASALLELMPGLDPSSVADFRQCVDDSLNQAGTLSRDRFADF